MRTQKLLLVGLANLKLFSLKALIPTFLFGSVAVAQETVEEAAAVKFVVIANEFDKPEFARLYFSETCEVNGLITKLKTIDGSEERFIGAKVKLIIEMPETRFDLINPSQFKQTQKSLNELTEAVKVYPHLRTKLLPLGHELKTILDARANGYIKQDGRWIPARVSASDMNETANIAENEDAIGTVTMHSGKTFNNVIVFRVEPNGLNVRHDGGVTKLSFLELPEELRKRYGYDPEKAAIFASQEHENSKKVRLLTWARKEAYSRGALVEATIDPSAWKELPEDASLTAQITKIRFYKDESKITVTPRTNAVGGVGLPDTTVSTERVYSEPKTVTIVSTTEYVDGLADRKVDKMIFPATVADLTSTDAPSEPVIYAFELEVAAKIMAQKQSGEIPRSLLSKELTALESEAFGATIFQDLGNGAYLIEIRDDMYKLEGAFNQRLEKGDWLRFVGHNTGEIFQYKNAFGQTRSVYVIKLMSIQSSY